MPIVFTPDGRILDGRMRNRAIRELLDEGFMPRVLSRVATTDEMLDPVAFVLSVNAARRQLTGDQVIALYLTAHKATIKADKQVAKIAQQAGLKKGSTRPEPVSTTVKPTGKTAAKVAKAVGKSQSAVERVQRVQKLAPERFAEVVEGKASAVEILKQAPEAKTPVPKQNGTETIVPRELLDEIRRTREALDVANEEFDRVVAKARADIVVKPRTAHYDAVRKAHRLCRKPGRIKALRAELEAAASYRVVAHVFDGIDESDDRLIETWS